MINVAIVDDHPIVRSGLRGLLGSDKELVVVAEAGDGGAAVEVARSGRVDVMLLDLSMPGRGGFTLLQRLLNEAPGMRIVVLSMYDPETHRDRAIALGASEYLPKGSSSESIISAIKQAATLPQPRRGKRSARDLHATLSNRQYDVLIQLVSGRSVTEIAAELNLSVKTVSSHKIAVQRRLGAGSLVDLVNYANLHALVTRPDDE